LGILAEVLYPKQIPEQKEWLKNSCHQLKHEFGSAKKFYSQMVLAMTENKLTETMREKLQASITYFTANSDQTRHKRDYLKGSKQIPQ